MVQDLKILVADYCIRFGVPYPLICGIIEIESEWNPRAIRYEPGFIYLERANDFAKSQKRFTSLETEKALQRMSWGLMQCMGGNIRRCGYQEHLADLIGNTEIALNYALLFFKKTCEHYTYNSDKIAVWNHGSVQRKPDGTYVNQDYVDEVTHAMKSYHV